MTNLTGLSLGRYHILEQLGEGGMATVYKAYDSRLERDVAVKIIRRGAFPEEHLDHILKRFEREAKALARLTHPNIVGVIDYGDHENAPYLVMPYLPGGTLKQRLGKPMPWQEAVRILLPIAQALEYAHEHNIIHRDIKPSNILLTEKGQPMLSDFGIAKILENEDAATLTGTGTGVGTPEYMAPEQWTGQAGTLSDLYSLGVVLYEMVTGHKPYTADTPAAILLKQASEPLPRPAQFVAGLPEAVEKVLFKALAKKPEDRFRDMAGFTVSLEKLLSASWSYERSAEYSLQKKRSKFSDTQDALRDVKGEAANSPSSPSNTHSWRPWMVGAAGLLLLVVIVIAILVVPGMLVTPVPEPTHSSDLIIGSTSMRLKDGMQMVAVPAGEFTMGSNDRNTDERPVHTVFLDAYWIDKTEVTNAMYARCVEAGACQTPSDLSSFKRTNYYSDSLYKEYPVIYVSWNDANLYCQWAGGRLPTEAEWEKAARGTDGRIYPWGNTHPTCDEANILTLAGNAIRFINPISGNACVGDTSKVVAHLDGVSPYGALDMAGNVWEWVNDWYGDSYYSQSPESNPQGPSSAPSRVLRGGSWGGSAETGRASNRNEFNPTVSNYVIGFRCALSP
jgi:serine/threonine protein kinase